MRTRKSTFNVPFFSEPKISLREKRSFPCVPSNRTHMQPSCPVDYRGLRAIMVLLRVYPLHWEWTGSFGDLYLPGSLCFCRDWMSISRLDGPYLSPVSSNLAIMSYIPTFVSGQLHFCAILSLYTTTVIGYFLWKSRLAFLLNRQCFVNSSRSLSITDADIFAHLIQRLGHLSPNCYGIFFTPMKWFCDYPLEWSAKCQFTTLSELQTFYLLHFSR